VRARNILRRPRPVGLMSFGRRRARKRHSEDVRVTISTLSRGVEGGGGEQLSSRITGPRPFGPVSAIGSRANIILLTRAKVLPQCGPCGGEGAGFTGLRDARASYKGPRGRRRRIERRVCDRQHRTPLETLGTSRPVWRDQGGWTPPEFYHTHTVVKFRIRYAYFCEF